MSSIRVWTSNGKWSEEVKGLDKIHFMKETVKENLLDYCLMFKFENE